jgi:hypothetical protein
MNKAEKINTYFIMVGEKQNAVTYHSEKGCPWNSIPKGWN